MVHLKELKKKSPADLVEMAESLGVESASTLRKQDLLFAILKEQAENGEQVMIDGTCASACTMLLGVIPRNRICVTPRAVLAFHSAWTPTSARRAGVRRRRQI